MFLSQYEMIHLMNFEVERTSKLRGEYFLCKASSTLHGFLKSAPAFLGDSSHKQVWLGEVPEEALKGSRTVLQVLGVKVTLLVSHCPGHWY